MMGPVFSHKRPHHRLVSIASRLGISGVSVEMDYDAVFSTKYRAQLAGDFWNVYRKTSNNTFEWAGIIKSDAVVCSYFR